MHVQVSFSSKVPLRVQLVDQIKLHLATGTLRPGQQLPTVRDLAQTLSINPSTVAKAYHELERAGIIVTHRGGGSFLADPQHERLLADRRDERLDDILAAAAIDALGLGYQPEEIEARFVTHLARWRERRSAGAPSKTPIGAEQLRFCGSHDLAIELLVGRLKRDVPELDIAVRYAGSLGGLIALEQGDANIAGTHLLDAESGEYNLPFVRRLLAGQEATVFTLAERWQGLIFRRGNPKAILGLDDLVRPDVTFVNRQRGSGTRVLLDYQLRALNISADRIRGYAEEEQTHVGVAARVAEGSADVGLGIESVARASWLDFSPLVKERYDLVMLASAREALWFLALMRILQDEGFRKVVAAMGGYDLERCGLPISPGITT